MQYQTHHRPVEAITGFPCRPFSLSCFRLSEHRRHVHGTGRPPHTIRVTRACRLAATAATLVRRHLHQIRRCPKADLRLKTWSRPPATAGFSPPRPRSSRATGVAGERAASGARRLDEVARFYRAVSRCLPSTGVRAVPAQRHQRPRCSWRSGPPVAQSAAWCVSEASNIQVRRPPVGLISTLLKAGVALMGRSIKGPAQRSPEL